MFRRLPRGLPKEPVFAQDLKGLGYFINEKDEIRSIANPKAYFNFFITKNERHNVLQREGMNEAIRNIIIERLEDLGLSKLRLPLGATETDKHLNILISDGLKEKKKIIVLFGEACQDLGVFAHRVIGGKGGINAGSAVNFVKNIQEAAAKAGKEAPGIILANLGHQCWSTRLKKAITWVSWDAIPRKSAADPPYHFDEYKNTIPGNKNAAEHVAYVFENVLGNPDYCDQESKIHILGVSDGATHATWYLHDPARFSKWCKGIEPAAVYDWSASPAEKVDGSFAHEHYIQGDSAKNPRIVSLAVVAATVTLAVDPENSLPEFYEITNPEFKKWFAEKARAYSLTTEPAGVFLAPPEGYKIHQALGAPAFSLGETTYTERMLVMGQKIILDWFAEVGDNTQYFNPEFTRLDYGSEEEENIYGEGEVFRAEDAERYSNLRNGTVGITSGDADEAQQFDLSYNLPYDEKTIRAKLSNAFQVFGGESGNEKIPSWSEIKELDGADEVDGGNGGLTLDTQTGFAEALDSDEEESKASSPVEKVAGNHPKKNDDGEVDPEETITFGGPINDWKTDPEVGAY